MFTLIVVRPFVHVLTLALCALAATGCGGGSAEPASTATSASAEADAPASGRDRAPAIAGTSLDGEPISLADYRGRAVLVNVWSSW